MIKVKEDMTGWKMCEHGVPNSLLTIIKQVEDYVSPSGERRPQWLCQCSCGSQPFIAVQRGIKNGSTASCGCLTREKKSKSHKKYNTYDLSGEYGIGYTSNTNEPFYFDLEDYDKIKDYCWRTSRVGKNKRQKTLRAYINKKFVTFHIHLGYKNYDHINRNELDNRKENLRPATKSQNAQNNSISVNNTSGFTGVHWDKRLNKWCSRININKKESCLDILIKKKTLLYQDFKRKQFIIKNFHHKDTYLNNIILKFYNKGNMSMYNKKYIIEKIEEFNCHNPIYDGVEGRIAYPAYFNVGERGWFLWVEDGWFKEFAHRIHTSLIQSVEYLDDEIVVETMNTRFVFRLVSK